MFWEIKASFFQLFPKIKRATRREIGKWPARELVCCISRDRWIIWDFREVDNNRHSSLAASLFKKSYVY